MEHGGGGGAKDKEGRKEGAVVGENWNDNTLHFDNRIWRVCLTWQAFEPTAFAHSLKQLFTTCQVFYFYVTQTSNQQHQSQQMT